jgi:hypothetical protein
MFTRKNIIAFAVVLSASLWVDGCNTRNEIAAPAPPARGDWGSGSMMFESNRGNFSAEGGWDGWYSWKSGVGGGMGGFYPGDPYWIDATGYFARSSTDIAKVHLVIDSLDFNGPRSYPLRSGWPLGPAKLEYYPHLNPSDTLSTLDGYWRFTGVVTVTSLTSGTTGTIIGEFSGSAPNELRSTDTLVIRRGSFTINYVRRWR